MEKMIVASMIGIYPTTRESCDDLFKKINESIEENIIIDFKDVIGITNSFASQYLFNINKCKKNILEKNKNKNIVSMLEITNKIKKPTKVEYLEITHFQL